MVEFNGSVPETVENNTIPINVRISTPENDLLATHQPLLMAKIVAYNVAFRNPPKTDRKISIAVLVYPSLLITFQIIIQNAPQTKLIVGRTTKTF
jgi:hypothetical protein